MWRSFFKESILSNRILADNIIESGALFVGPWELERVGHEQWVLRGSKKDLPRLFRMLEGVTFRSSDKLMIELTADMKLAIHKSVEHIQLRIYNKERMETLVRRDERKLRVTPDSIEKVKAWLNKARESGVSQLSYLIDTLAIFEEEEGTDGPL